MYGSQLKSSIQEALLLGAVCLLSFNLVSASHQNWIYPRESIAWKSCGEIKNRSLECSQITVPMDHFNATNSGNKTFTIPLIRSRGQNATKNVLYNPGGPGISGVGYMYMMADKFQDIVGEGFHFVSFDPRGVNGSRPAANYFPETAKRKMQNFPYTIIHQGIRPEDMGELVAGTSTYVRACADTMGEHGRYINTPQTAADMNAILDALGQKDMLYYGTSYGTILGQTYAAMYPERSKRIIIDGVANIFEWYSELVGYESMIDSERVFQGFLDECVKAGPKNCSLAAAAPDAPQLKAKILSLVEDLRVQPLPVYINVTEYGTVTAEMVLHTAILTALYQPLMWPKIADDLSKLLRGNGTAIFRRYGRMDWWMTNILKAMDFVLCNDGKSGPDHWRQGARELKRRLAPMWNASIFAAVHNGWYLSKQQWLIPKTHNFSLERPGADGQPTVETAHPILILSTTYDPVTPMISAKAAKSAFKDSQIVEVKGFGHTTLAEPSRCLLHKFRDYLYYGTLPDGHVTCEVDLPYFPFIKDREGIKYVGSHVKEDEEKGFQAQVALAGMYHGLQL